MFLPRRSQRTGRAARLLVTVTAILLLGFTGPAHPSSVVGRGLRILDSNYLFVDQLDSRRLLAEALAFMEARIPPLSVQALDGDAYLLTAGPCTLRIEAPPSATVTALEEVLTDVGGLVDGCVSDLPTHLVSSESLLLASVLSALDPYSTIFDAERKTEHTIQFRGKLAGIGARIGIRREQLTLISVYKESPAYKAGLRDGDVVQRVDGLSTTNLPVSDAVQHIRGEVGTPVRLTVLRRGIASAKTYTVIRDLVTIPSVTARRLASGVVYAEISHFSQTTPEDFRRRVAEAIGNTPAAGIIIDLRENSGGSMLGSSAIGDLFLEDGLLITTAGRKGTNVSGLTTEIRATSDTPFRDLPVAILTSPRTASGSELLAASLRNHDRTLLVGERTFGKGTVQKTYALGEESSLKLTVGHFLPNGLSIPGGGMLPDIEIRKLRLFERNVFLPMERDDEELPFWLRTPAWLESSDLRPFIVLDVVDTSVPEDEGDELADEVDEDAVQVADETVELADGLLSRFGFVSAKKTLSLAREWLARKRTEADFETVAVLEERGVDWREAGSLTVLQGLMDASLGVAIRPVDHPLRAGDESELEVRVTNTGERPLFRLYGTIMSEAGFLAGKGVLIGFVAPGETVSRRITVKPPKGMRASRLDATIVFHNDYGLSVKSAPMYLPLESAPRPLLAFRARVAEGDDLDLLNVFIDIENRGAGDAEDVRVFLKHPESTAVELTDGSQTIDLLPAGKRSTVRLGLRLLESSETPADVELVIAESVFGIFLDRNVAAIRNADDAWHIPPEIRFVSIAPDQHGEGFTIAAEVSDDAGVATVWALVDGRQVDFLDSTNRGVRLVRVDLPWKPDRGVERIELVATDSDGLTSRYVTEL